MVTLGEEGSWSVGQVRAGGFIIRFLTLIDYSLID